MQKRMIAFLLCLAAVGFGLELRKEPEVFRVSVIIPCHHRHFALLENLLECLERGTAVPDEVVVSVSEFARVDPVMAMRLEGRRWPFDLVVVKQREKCSPGRNRNAACEKCSGNLVICQDADDLPHPQRIETIRRAFEMYQIDMLVHLWLPSGGMFTPFDGWEEHVQTFRVYERGPEGVHNGSVSFMRRVFDVVKWKRGFDIAEDQTFNRLASTLFPRWIFLNLPLICYRGEHSTFRLDEGRVID